MQRSVQWSQFKCPSLTLFLLLCALSGNKWNRLTQVDVQTSEGSLLLFVCFRSCGPLCSVKMYICISGSWQVGWQVLAAGTPPPPCRSAPEALLLSLDFISVFHSWPLSEPHSRVVIALLYATAAMTYVVKANLVCVFKHPPQCVCVCVLPPVSLLCMCVWRV